MNVGVGASRYFPLELIGPCPDIDWTQRLAIRTRGSSWICRGQDADLLVPELHGAQTCSIRAVRQLTVAEVAASELPAAITISARGYCCDATGSRFRTIRRYFEASSTIS